MMITSWFDIMSKDELARAVAASEAKAEMAERNGLPKTAKAWLALADTLRTSVARTRDGFGCVTVERRIFHF